MGHEKYVLLRKEQEASLAHRFAGNAKQAIERETISSQHSLQARSDPRSLSSSAVRMLQRTIGNRAVAQMVQAEEESTIQTLDPSPPTSAIQGQPDRVDDIPPPPPSFPYVYDWLMDSGIQDALIDAWNFSSTDNLERGFGVLWNQNTNKVFTGDVVTGGTMRVNVPIPADQPPVYPIGWFHTHTRGTPGYVRILGPSQQDRATSDQSRLPGVVEDFKTMALDPRDASYYLFGPNRRSYY